MTPEEVRALPVTVRMWPTAGRALGLGKTLTYELAQRGEFPLPVHRLGNRWVVVTADLQAFLGISRTPP